MCLIELPGRVKKAGHRNSRWYLREINEPMRDNFICSGTFFSCPPAISLGLKCINSQGKSSCRTSFFFPLLPFPMHSCMVFTSLQINFSYIAPSMGKIPFGWRCKVSLVFNRGFGTKENS